jgi:oligoribonuclease NrnB/cAMP/cGMP phosphodiesterase (DHH superfamily)
MERICFYHADCPDGFGAAWAVWRAWGGNAHYLPRHHEERLDSPSFRESEVVFVDMVPTTDDLARIAEEAQRLIVLDHHFSSRNRLAALPELMEKLRSAGHLIHFDLEHSAAVLAWRYFHPRAVPELLLYVEDRDLWSQKLPSTREVNAALDSYPRTFDAWEALAARPMDDLAREGAPILRAQRAEVERSLKFAHPVQLDGALIEAVNERHLRSPLGHELSHRATFGRPWGLVYRVSGSRVDVSLYSIGELDVAAIASGFGGGGHLNAAGFSVPLRTWLNDFLPREIAADLERNG